ncbi:MAG: hypothetical protein EBX47_10380 [Synechococcaceae bacterium WB8_1B_057]|nr:hypothetical protein [Synechococcaceae bacterium WB6_1A_059]NDG79819.1 hypothetical protein [Synechococcaceae bacterium WB8_1B_057]
MATAEDYAKMSDSEKKKEDWMNSKWRPMMGWLYMATCTFDFIIFPMVFAILQTIVKGQIVQWQPLTLQGAGLYHIAMGAVLGLAAWGRTQEKLNGVNNGGLAPVSQSVTTTFGQPQAGGFGSPPAGGFGGGGFGSAPNTGFQQPPAGNFGATAGGFSGAAPVAAAAGLGAAAAMAVPFISNEVLTGPGGKPMPVQPPDPEI